VTSDGSSGYSPEFGRYHLYISYACPWSHRTLLVRALRQLEAVISVSVTDYYMSDKHGWRFTDALPDHVNGTKYVHELYTRTTPTFSGHVTVPVLWDKQTGVIVNNESRDIIRMFDTAFIGFGDPSVNLRPGPLEADIDHVIDRLYEAVNNGVYRAGFATEQRAYEEAFTELFDELAHWESVLSKQRYLLGDVLTEADVCLFVTLLRFDPVYHYHFKCNLRRLRDFENLWNYTKDIFQMPRVRATCNFEHIKAHYYLSHTSINPRRIIPKGPLVDFDEPHDRGRFG
jgi:putative glutathione S-transferase